MSDEELLKVAEEKLIEALKSSGDADYELSVCQASSLLVIARNSIPVNVEMKSEERHEG